MNDNCDKFLEQANELLDGNLDFEEQKKLQEHLKICSNCHQELNELETTLRLVHSLKDFPVLEARETFAEDIITQLEKETTKRHPAFLHKSGLIAATAILALLIAFTMFSLNLQKSPKIATQNTDSGITEEYTENFNQIFREQDNSILAEAGLPTDEWGLLDLDKL
jgi:predicted anti-sigma-YlaC factor YlaD